MTDQPDRRKSPQPFKKWPVQPRKKRKKTPTIIPEGFVDPMYTTPKVPQPNISNTEKNLKKSGEVTWAIVKWIGSALYYFTAGAIVALIALSIWDRLGGDD